MRYINHKNKALNYLREHVEFNATVHALGGFAVGMLVVHFFDPQNPVILAVVAGFLSVLGHLYAASNGKK